MEAAMPLGGDSVAWLLPCEGVIALLVMSLGRGATGWRRHCIVGGGGATGLRIFVFFCEITKKKTCAHPLDPLEPSLDPPIPTREGFICVSPTQTVSRYLFSFRPSYPFSPLTYNPYLLVTQRGLNRTVPNHPVFKSLADG
jgi:hypothetical protein